MDPISLLVGAALLVAGGILGRITRPQRAPSPYTCACKHSLSFHNPETNKCTECKCRQYLGERPLTELDPMQILRNLKDT